MAAFFTESGLSVAGVIVPPDGYLRRCYAAVRGQGGVCVADEVRLRTSYEFSRVGLLADCLQSRAGCLAMTLSLLC